ncbi:unnamed protein product [Discosporangium mesarthrocarpum]
MGIIASITPEDVSSIEERYLALDSTDVTLHVDDTNHVINVGTSTRCLIRPRTVPESLHTPCSGISYDSMLISHLELTANKFTEVIDRSDPEQFVNLLTRMTPYVFHNQPPRPSLALGMSMIDSCSDSSINVTEPGVSLIVIFMNHPVNFEDAAIISEAVNKQGLCKHGHVFHPVPDDTELPATGSKVTSSNSWWRPSTEGTVIGSGVSTDNRRYISALLVEMSPSVGDKWVTPHRQKFVISRILPENDMPTCTCRVTKAVFKPRVILSSSCIFNRTTFGQLYEGFKAAMAVDISSYDPRDPGASLIASCRDDMYDFQRRGLVCQSVDVNYGVCRFWQLSHPVRDKQHYMSKIPRSLRPLRGRLSVEGVSLGEMEVQALMTKGHRNCMKELMDKNDMVIFKLCPT